MEHPLQQTLEQAGQVNSYLQRQVGEPTEPGWLAVETLFAPNSEQFAHLIALAQKELRTGTATMVGTTLLQRYQWSLISTALICYRFARRVPDLQMANLRLHWSDAGRIDRIAFANHRFAALPDDPAVDHPDAVPVADGDELRNYLRHGLELHLGHVIEQLHQRVGSSRRGLWLVAADSCADELVWFMQQQNPAIALAQVEAEVRALLQHPGSALFHKKLEIFPLTYQAKTQIHYGRTTCCYWYKYEGGDYCTVCPHRTKEERNTRLLQHMAEEAAQVA